MTEYAGLTARRAFLRAATNVISMLPTRTSAATGTFESQLIKKHQTHLTDELERKILPIFEHGMGCQAIRHYPDIMAVALPNKRTGRIFEIIAHLLQ